jgi:hypothetical protein
VIRNDNECDSTPIIIFAGTHSRVLKVREKKTNRNTGMLFVEVVRLVCSSMRSQKTFYANLVEVLPVPYTMRRDNGEPKRKEPVAYSTYCTVPPLRSWYSDIFWVNKTTWI